MTKKKKAKKKVSRKKAKRPVGRPRLSEKEKLRREKLKDPKRVLASKESHQRLRRRELTLHSQDIGDIHDCVNTERRDKAIASFKVFCDTYFSPVFFLPWSKDLLRVCEKVEQVVIRHDKVVILMPRGSGKSSLCKVAVLWAILSGRHKYVKLIGAVSNDAVKALNWFKDELTENDLLYEDFPQVCVPVRKLDNEPRRALGQRYKGKKTNIRWGKDRIVLANIPGCCASQAVIETNSLEGHIRGAWIRIEGKILRPTLAICDDPQTPESARSQGPDGQTAHRMAMINQDVQGLAGPTHRTALLIPATIIERNDLADQLLRDKKYHGERMKRIYSMPKNMDLWDRYREIYNTSIDDIPGLNDEATEYYKKRMCDRGRKVDEPATICEKCSRRNDCMDCDAVVDWADRIDDPDNLSAIQAAMHSMYNYGPAGFAAEFQNEPLASETAARLPTEIEICEQASGYKRGTVPPKSIHLSAFIDIGDDYLAWLVAAWQPNFTGCVIDYGTWPDQGRLFSKNSVSNPLGKMYPRSGVDGAIVSGLRDLSERLLGRQFAQEGAPPLQIGLCLVDTGYKPDAVYSALRMLGRGPVIRPSRGRGITAGRTQFDDYRRDRCREMGLHWWIPKDSTQAVIQIDTNYWKTFIHSRLATSVGDPGSLSLFGKPEDHKMLADHILAEYYTMPSTEKGIQIQEWHQHVGKDNEWFDCLVGAAVAASKLGCSILPAGRHKIIRPVRKISPIVNSSYMPEFL